MDVETQRIEKKFYDYSEPEYSYHHELYDSEDQDYEKFLNYYEDLQQSYDSLNDHSQSTNQTLKQAIEGEMKFYDSAWLMGILFIMFAMQTGHSLFGAGALPIKNEVNVFMNSIFHLVIGGSMYWAVGFGLNFGLESISNPFCGWGYFLLEVVENSSSALPLVHFFYASFLFYSAALILGRGVSERMTYLGYFVLCFMATFIFCIPAGWIWRKNGFLKELGVLDVAGACSIHVVGGFSSIAITLFLGPRIGRWRDDNAKVDSPELGRPSNAIIGAMMIWFSWLSQIASATYGIGGNKWILSAAAFLNSVLASYVGGVMGFVLSMFFNDGRVDILTMANSIFAALISIMSCCTNVNVLETIAIAMIGTIVNYVTSRLFILLKIDDPLSNGSLHGVTGIWSMIAGGLCAKRDNIVGISQYDGLFRGGGFYLLGIQVLSCLVSIVWSVSLTLITLFLSQCFIKVRLSEHEELLGNDYIDHMVHHDNQHFTRIVSAVAKRHPDIPTGYLPTGKNSCHTNYVEKYVPIAEREKELKKRRRPSIFVN